MSIKHRYNLLPVDLKYNFKYNAKTVLDCFMSVVLKKTVKPLKVTCTHIRHTTPACTCQECCNTVEPGLLQKPIPSVRIWNRDVLWIS